MNDDFDLDDFLNSPGELETPTMRGQANLDVEDYQRIPGIPDSSLLDDDLLEDTPSRPEDGAGPAPDIDGMDAFDLTDTSIDEPGMDVSDYGSHPWKVGGGGGYRPNSMMRTDLAGDAAGSPDEEIAVRTAAQAVPVPPPRRDPQRNRQPSNADVDPETLYDDWSYEEHGDPQNVIGNGIFGMEEGVVWRPRDGSFSDDFAYPAYWAHEGELDVMQSEMWDSVANNWRTVQPSTGGVALTRRVPSLRRPADPFVSRMPSMAVERTGPRSHIEAFGRRAAKCVVDEARLMRSPADRSRFLTVAIEALGPGQATKCRQVSDRLVAMGYKPDTALEDTLAHCMMHALMRDLGDRAKGKNGLPRIDKMGANVRANAQNLQAAVTQHVAPIATDAGKARADVTALQKSPAAAGMGQVATPEATSSNMGRNLLIGAAMAGVGYYFLTRTKEGRAVQRNVRRGARKFARTMGVK